jgi:hypothetical protein
MNDAPPEFISGIDLCRAFYRDAVRPILDAAFPGVAHSAAIIGSGSEVVGFDSARSTDHHWGPRAMLFLREEDLARFGQPIHDALAQQLPAVFMGFSTNFGPPDEGGTRLREPVDGPPIAHRAELAAWPAYARSMLRFDPNDGVTTAHWMLTPSQRLLELTAGEVFHDGLPVLERARAALRWYPHDVWLYLIASQWQRIAEEESFVGRCSEAGDELGSRVVAARVARDLMRLCFLFERGYSPYSKWLGTAFARLACGARLVPLLDAALAADDYPAREDALCAAYEAAATMHNALAITPPVDPGTRLFYDRPYRVLRAERFADATRGAIAPTVLAEVRALPGAIDQWVDNTTFLSRSRYWGSLDRAYFAASAEHEA